MVDSCLKTFPQPVNAATRPSATILRRWPAPNTGQERKRKEPRMPDTMSDTMAEAFCEEYLVTWTEHGEDFTDWLDGDT